MKSSWYIKGALGWIVWLLMVPALAQETIPDRLVLKVDPSLKAQCLDHALPTEALRTVLEDRMERVTRLFPNAAPPELYKRGQVGVELGTIYEVHLSPGISIPKLCRELQALSEVVYAEPEYISYIDFTPNDPLYVDLVHLPQVKATDAWDIQEGDASITIAILDTGTDPDHPDLQSQHAQNAADPVNGNDDDQNGYVDDISGWDFIDDDNDPSATVNDHGIHVAGIAAAAVNNGIGIAGVGYRSTFIPVRVGEDRAITRGYQGIVYAADLGADIINCSWGSYTFSDFAQDVVTYATLNKGSLIIASSGNDARETPYYPAAYQYVLSVGSVRTDDIKSSFSNFGYWVDISAPGNNVLSTSFDGTYARKTGTSMSSPVVSGAAALVKAQYPQLTPMQIGERLKSTCEDIDPINNSIVQNKIGSGRLDVEAAVQGTITTPAVVITDPVLLDGDDNAFVEGDSVTIGVRFTNYLNPTGFLNATLTTSSSFIQIVDNDYTLGTLATNEQKDNYSEPFRLAVLPGTPVNEVVDLRIRVEGGGYVMDHYFTMNVNVDYLNITVNEAITTVTSRGNVGYNQRDTDQGLGFIFRDGPSLLYEAGLMIGARVNGTEVVVDNVRNSPNTDDRDFESVEVVRALDPPTVGVREIQGVFSDTGATGDSLEAVVRQRAWAFDDAGHQDYTVFQYEVINVSQATWSDVRLGMLADWDIGNYELNRATSEADRFLAYSSGPDEDDPVAGVMLLDGTGLNIYSIDNVSGGQGGVDIISGYTTEKKMLTMENSRSEAGLNGNDVLQIISSGPYTLDPGDTATVTFAFMAADHPIVLREIADSAYFRFNNRLPLSTGDVLQVGGVGGLYPQPVTNTLRWNGPADAQAVIEVRDIQGRWIGQYRVQGHEPVDVSNWPAGIYLARIETEAGTQTVKFIKN